MKITSDDYLVRPPTAGLTGITLPELFAATVAAAPDDVAVTTGVRPWTWRQWQADSDAMASGLQACGVRPGDVIAVQLPNTEEFLALHTAVATVGAVLLPLHEAYGAADVEALLDHVQPAMVIDSQTPLLSLAGAATRPLEPVKVLPDMPFVAMPSSGTTSDRPKICLHSHDGLLSNAAAVALDGTATADDVIVSASPFTHLFGLLSLHVALYTRARQALIGTWSVDKFLQVVANSGASVLYAVPAQLSDIVSAPETNGIELRWVRTGGATVARDLVGEVRRRVGAGVIVQWGMSEVGAGTYTSATDPDYLVPSSVGSPVAGSQVRVVDGELQFRGSSMFRGYLGEAELTRQAVTPDGWLRTGDLAEIDSHGRVVYQSRSSELLNVGGRKFAVREIEELLTHLGRVAVVGRPDTRLGEYPCLVVDRPDVTLAEATRALRAAGVAEYKIPLDLVTVAAIPLTPSGKISRRRLADLVATHGLRPKADLVQLVRHSAARALDRGDLIGPDTTFRDYGIDSMSAIRLSNDLEETIGELLPSSIVFDYPTPRALARYLSGPNPSPEPPAAEPPLATPDDDPVVIVGMGCRLPGGITTPEQLWQLLVDGGEVRGSFPTDRGWPADLCESGASMTATGGFLDRIDTFDHEFFGLTPREARTMDPQHRVLLEVAWEALERAGMPAESLRGSDMGVFVGMMASDYQPRWTESPGSYDGTLVLGTTGSVASGRLAYFLGLTGPAITVDTACSSALVAMHLAVSAIERGECRSALVGAATLMCTPTGFVEFSRQRMLAPDGRCKAFAAAADGASWSEGVAAIVVERLSQARQANHRVLAVMRGSAVNQDGASNGLTAPNGPAQREVIRNALRAAGLRAADIDAVEAHGTGTPLGDPIEAHALQHAYGDRDRPLWIGSVKSNLGHTQAAAGLVSVIKVVLAMGHGTLPATLHVDEPSPHIDWASGAVRLVARTMPWPGSEQPRRVGVSAFGMSGTNAHMILEGGADDQARSEPVVPMPWILSARSATDLTTMGARLLDVVGRNERWTSDAVARTLATRTAFPHRAVLLGDHRRALRALVDGHDDADLVVDVARPPGRVVFVFPGQGTQWPGMARRLLVESPVFAEAFTECARALREHVDWSPSALVLSGVDLMAEDRLQPVLFAVMVSLARTWQAYGVQPDAVVGHSQGEVAAVHIAGGLSLSDAARIVTTRSRLLRRLTGRGRMAWLPLPADSDAWGDRLSVSAINDPRSVVVFGADGDIAEALSVIPGAKALPIHCPSHSGVVAEIRDELLAGLAPITPQPGGIPFYSTVTASEVDTSTLTPEYWYRNLRERVEFARTTTLLAERGHTHFVEISPHPVLTHAIEHTADVVAIPTLRRDEGDLRQFHRSVALAYARGVPIPWDVGLGEHADLPTYPFQPERHWLGDTVEPARPLRVAHTDLLRAIGDAAAAVSGRKEPLPADATFQSQGFTSLLAMELRDRLARLLGRALPASVALDHNTPRLLARHLTDGPDPAIPQGFEQVYRRLCTAGAFHAAVEMISEAARLRPAFTAVDVVVSRPVRLASGAAPTMVVCFTSVSAMSAPTEYTRFAEVFDGTRDVHVVPEPGFADGQSLPDDIDALAAAHEAAVTALVGDRPYVLCGHSSGGWIAHLVAERLTERRPAGIVLLDSAWPSSAFVSQEIPRMLGVFIEREQALGIDAVGMTRLTAMGAYLRMLREWTPTETTVPVLHVAAANQGAVWQLPHVAAESSGDHFSMLDSSAGVIGPWLDRVDEDA